MTQQATREMPEFRPDFIRIKPPKIGVEETHEQHINKTSPNSDSAAQRSRAYAHKDHQCLRSQNH